MQKMPYHKLRYCYEIYELSWMVFYDYLTKKTLNIILQENIYELEIQNKEARLKKVDTYLKRNIRIWKKKLKLF